MKRTLVESVSVKLWEMFAMGESKDGRFIDNWYTTARRIIAMVRRHDALAALATRHARAIEALSGCVSCIDHLTHGVRDKDAETNIIAAAREILEGK